MNTMIKFATVGVVSLALVACEPGNNTTGATLAGAAAGGLLGAAAFGGGSAQWVGIVGGALLGSVVGNQIGKYMDRQDEANMQNAIVKTPVGSQAQWTNSKTNTTYVVRPVKNYTGANNNYCREYQTTVTINGKAQQGYGRACRQPDGTWRIVS